jgi:3-oxoacyl-[acyl-carrier-protein] synthase III
MNARVPHSMMSPGFSAAGYFLPPIRQSVEDLAATGRVTSSPEKLRELGYETIHVAGKETAAGLARSAVADLVDRTGFDLSKIGMILYGSGLAVNSMVAPGEEFAWAAGTNPLPFFKYPASQLQHALGLPHVPVLGVTQLACCAFQGCVRLASGILHSEPEIDDILCVTADRFPKSANREIVYNVMSDGACAAVVSRNVSRHRLLSTAQLSRGIYWDGEASHDRLIAATFPLVRQVFVEALARAQVDVEELKLVIPHNINARCWDILAHVLGVPAERIYTENIARIGHAVASDNTINYIDAWNEGRLRAGDKVALLVTGFGAHWNCMIVEV